MSSKPQRSLAGPSRPRASLPDRLIDSAEALIGRHGIEGVSLREIGAHAGSGNNSAVQSCFGDIHGLISAIVERRGQQVEALRGRMLAQLEPHKLDVGDYVAVLIRPVLELVNERGERVFARFWLALSNSTQALRHWGRK